MSTTPGTCWSTECCKVRLSHNELPHLILVAPPGLPQFNFISNFLIFFLLFYPSVPPGQRFNLLIGKKRVCSLHIGLLRVRRRYYL